MERVLKHKFPVGTRVLFTASNVARPAASGSYEVIRLLPTDRAQVGAFNDKIQLSGRFTNNRDELISALNDLQFGNPTRLNDAIATSLDVFQRTDRPNQFVILGAWADQKAFETHNAGDAAKKLKEKLATMLAAPTDTRQHNGLSVAPAKAGKDAIFAVTHVDVIPPEKDNGANALEQLADGSRRHAGNLQFDVWRQTNRPNHFTVVESWANRGAFDVHEMQKETREFRMRLGPMSGALYDERLYRAL